MKKNIKTKEMYFEVEFIHVLDFDRFSRNSQGFRAASHKLYRGLTLKQLVELIKENQNISRDDPDKVILNIRGETY